MAAADDKTFICPTKKHLFKRINLNETSYTIMAERNHGTSQIVSTLHGTISIAGHEGDQGNHNSQQLSKYAIDCSDICDMPRAGTIEATKACAVRLQSILQRETEGTLEHQDLLNNLEYAVTVLNAVFLDETKRLCDEDDELTEVAPSSVPKEVKEWLTSTFTRSRSNKGDSGHFDRLKFRSVATAIRAGIVVDRIYRKLPSSIGFELPSDSQNKIKASLDLWSFNPFDLQETSSGEVLRFVSITLLHRYDIINKFKIPSHSLEVFLGVMEKGYSKHNNAYHNCMHAADVIQNCHMIMNLSRLPVWLTDAEIFALLFSALIHDYEHTGTNNAFHVNSSSRLALVYNDRGVLENHHVSAVFQCFVDCPEANILRNMDSSTFRIFRSLVVEMVLNTDMSLHFHQVKTMRSLLSMPESIEKCKVLSVALHAADISHPTKEWAIHQRWSECLCEEFFRQGDREKSEGLAVSPMCDRESCNLAQGQIGFIDVIVQPTFELLGDLMDRIIESLCDCKPAAAEVNDDAASQASSQVNNSFNEEFFKDGRIARPWDENLEFNKTKWMEQRDKEASL